MGEKTKTSNGKHGGNRKPDRFGAVLVCLAIISMLAVIALPFIWGTTARIPAPYEVVVMDVGPISFSTDVFFAEIFLLIAEGGFLAVYFLRVYLGGLKSAGGA